VVLKIAALLMGVFHLDRLGHSVLAFRAEEEISLLWTPKIKVFAVIFA